MQITPIQPNNNSFKALKMPKKVLFSDINNNAFLITKENLMQNPKIARCAEKYNVLINRGKKLGRANVPEKMYKTALKTIFGMSALGMYMYLPMTDVPLLGKLIVSIAGGVVGLGGAIIFGATELIDILLKPNIYEYTIQGVKKFKNNAQNELGDIKSKQYKFSSIEELKQIPELTDEIARQDKIKFFEVLNKHNMNDFSDADKILNILELPEIKENFYNGEVFNYPADKYENSLFLRFLDIVPNEKNQNDYNKILNIIKNMPNVDLIQKDNYGISSVEKILNSENHQTFELIKDIEIPYSKELDYAYEQIYDESFKRKAKTLNVKFDDIFKVIDIQSEKGLEEAMKQFDSPFCDKQKIATKICQMTSELKLKFRYPDDERKYQFLKFIVYPKIEEYLPEYMRKNDYI